MDIQQHFYYLKQMITKTNIKKETIQVGDEKLTVYETARWFCLLDALDLITKKSTALKVNLNDTNWVKPIALQKYIDERFHSVVIDVEKEKEIGKI